MFFDVGGKPEEKKLVMNDPKIPTSLSETHIRNNRFIEKSAIFVIVMKWI